MDFAGYEGFVDSDGVIYYLIPNNVINKFSGGPNTETTYLAESCKVTLGGGLTLTHTGTGTHESGTIKVE